MLDELLSYPKEANHSSEAEQAVIGAMLIDPKCITDVLAVLSGDEFYFDANREIYETMKAMSADFKPIDPVTLLKHMPVQDTGDDRAIQRYLLELMEITPTAANVLEYAAIVREKSQRRRLYELLTGAAKDIVYGGGISDVAAAVSTQLEKILSVNKSHVHSSLDAVHEWYGYMSDIADGKRRPVTATGLYSLDSKLGGGLLDGSLCVIGGRPGMGKTTVGLNIAANMSRAGKKVMFFTLEMSRLQITAKRVSEASGIPYQRTNIGPMTKDEFIIGADAASMLARERFIICDPPVVTVSDILTTAVSEKGLEALIIDYLGIIKPTAGTNRFEGMTEISNALKRLARRLNIPVICMAQLNRENEQRRNKRPILTDLRDTGAIEQDADVVIFVHRDSYYAQDAPGYDDEDYEDCDDLPDRIDLIIAKNRHLDTGTVSLAWNGETGKIY